MVVAVATGLAMPAGGGGATLGAAGVFVAEATGATGMTVSAHGASTVVVQPHSAAEYVTVVIDVLVGTAEAGQEEVWWQPHISS